MTDTCTYLGPDYDPQEWYKANPGLPTPYCGCATLQGKSYCSEHYAVVYAKGSALRKRHKDLRKVKYIQDRGQWFKVEEDGKVKWLSISDLAAVEVVGRD